MKTSDWSGGEMPTQIKIGVDFHKDKLCQISSNKTDTQYREHQLGILWYKDEGQDCHHSKRLFLFKKR